MSESQRATPRRGTSRSRRARGASAAPFAAGDVIVSQGDEGTPMYIVVEGEVDVSYDERCSVRLGVGEFFGEMSLIDKRARSATVTAVTDVTLARSARVRSWC